MVLINAGDDKFYMDDRLDEKLKAVEKRVNQKDEDYFWAVDGEEGGGKSVFALQLAKRVDPTFCIDRVCFTPKEFREAILKAKKGEAIVYDEAFRGLSSRGALSEVNKLLVSLMMECRQKNLFVIVVMPTFFLLDKYVALWRAKGLFHIYRVGGKRGQWVYFNKKYKKLLYLKGKSTYSYGVFRRAPSFRGRFVNHYTVDEKEYRRRKKEAFQKTNRNTRAENYLSERNLLLWYANRELGMSTTVLSNRLSELGWEIAQNSISEAIVKQENRMKKDGLLA